MLPQRNSTSPVGNFSSGPQPCRSLTTTHRKLPSGFDPASRTSDLLPWRSTTCALLLCFSCHWMRRSLWKIRNTADSEVSRRSQISSILRTYVLHRSHVTSKSTSEAGSLASSAVQAEPPSSCAKFCAEASSSSQVASLGLCAVPALHFATTSQSASRRPCRTSNTDSPELTVACPNLELCSVFAMASQNPAAVAVPKQRCSSLVTCSSSSG
mmetsp:Transcript_70611/g.228704  ORF Transcript_70611/g.228704 Transcript_70611/m.228704 type:complete len:212 (-) Transcript_70611:581-1216(-)